MRIVYNPHRLAKPKQEQPTATTIPGGRGLENPGAGGRRPGYETTLPQPNRNENPHHVREY